MEGRSRVSNSIEAILTSVSPELARRVEAQKAREKPARKLQATELAAFQAAERTATVTRKVQREVTSRAKTRVAEKLAELLALAAKRMTRRKPTRIGHHVT
jgi:hypothetical protein